jgi:hypothetical protein
LLCHERWAVRVAELIHNAIGHAAHLGVQQDALLAVQLANQEQFLPPMGLQAQKHCTRGDQGIDSIKIPLQIVELMSYCGFYLPAAWLLLFGDIEKSRTSSTLIISRLVFLEFWVLAAQVINDPLGRFPRLV